MAICNNNVGKEENASNQQREEEKMLVTSKGNSCKTSLKLSQTTNFRLFQTERLSYNYKFDENGRKFSDKVEKTVGKGEIALYEQFLLFPQYFQDLYCRHVKNQGLFGKGLNLGHPLGWLSGERVGLMTWWL